jgi:hypothetical protein
MKMVPPRSYRGALFVYITTGATQWAPRWCALAGMDRANVPAARLVLTPLEAPRGG